MIEILPMSDKKREENLLLNLKIEEADKPRVLLMTERGEELGFIKVAIRKNTLIVFEFALSQECDFVNLTMDQRFYVDTLMRSAASYGETNGATKIETVNAKYNSFLKVMGFTIDDQHAFTPMSTIVKYHA